MAGPHSHRSVPERDWQLLRELHPILVDRYCQRVFDEASAVTSCSEERPHQRYLRLYKLLRRRDKELGWAFNDLRRSTAWNEIAAARALKLLTDEEMLQFSFETQEAVKTLSAIMCGEFEEQQEQSDQP